MELAIISDETSVNKQDDKDTVEKELVEVSDDTKDVAVAEVKEEEVEKESVKSDEGKSRIPDWVKKLGPKCKIIFSDIAFLLADFGSDILNGVQLIRAGHPMWGGICLGLTAAPGTVIGLGVFSGGVKDRDITGALFGLVLVPFGWVLIPAWTVYG